MIEFGAGSGALAAQLLNALDRQGFHDLRYQIVELSADLRRQQRKSIAARLPQMVDRVEWLDAVPTGVRGVVVANELLEALAGVRAALSDVRGTATSVRLLDRFVRDLVWRPLDEVWALLTDITAANVSRLAPAWTFSTGILRGHEEAPLVVDNTLAALATRVDADGRWLEAGAGPGGRCLHLCPGGQRGRRQLRPAAAAHRRHRAQSAGRSDEVLRRLRGVLRHRAQQRELVAALGDANPHPAPPGLAEQLLEDGAVLGQGGDQDLPARDPAEMAADGNDPLNSLDTLPDLSPATDTPSPSTPSTPWTGLPGNG